MRGFFLVTLVVLLAGAASATNVWTIVWQETFDSDTLTDPADNPVTISDANEDTWLEAAAVWSSGTLRHATGGSGQNRGVALVLDPDNHPGMASGDYTLAFDIVSMYANCTMGVSIFDGTRDAGPSPANTYKLDLLSALSSPLVHETVGVGGELTLLASATYAQADVGTNKTMSFTWDGTGDVVLVFDTPLATNWEQRTVLDNMSLGAYLPLSSNNAPAFTADPFSAGAAAEEAAYSDTISGSATDDDDDALTYSKDDGPAWLKVASDGTLTGTPAQSDVGTNAFTVRVSDGKPGGFDVATLNIMVLNVPDTPAFAVDPIYKPSAFVGTAYSNSIACTAADQDGDALTYSILAGPAWLSLDPDGTLHGTPASPDLGAQVVEVQVEDGHGGSDTATMHVHVVPEPKGCGKPNILYILADDLGYCDVSAQAWSELEYKTPNIDSIFTGGARFRAALMSNSVCAPSRAGILTGRSGSRFGFEANVPHDYASLPGSTIGLDTNQVTMAEMLKTVGYRTYCIGKWHLGDNTDLFHPNVRGFDEFYGIIGGSRNYVRTTGLSDDKLIMSNDVVVAEPADMYITDFFTDQACDFMTDQTTSDPDQPWFMYLSYTAPHGPMDAKEADLARVPLVHHFGGEYSKDVPVKLLGTNGVVNAYSTRMNDALRQVYGAMVLSMDDNVGRLLNRLGALGIADRTLVVFHSDNGGPMQGSNWSRNNPLRGTKGSLWEGGIRVPFALQWPGMVPAGRVVEHDSPISALDMMPTFAAVSGADQVQDIRTDGINLMPLLRGRISSLLPRKLYWRRGTTTQIAIRSGGWKYYRNRTTGEDFLFDLSTGASEWWNEAPGNPSKVAELAADYAEYEATLPDPHWDADGEWLAITTYDLDEALTNQAYSMSLRHAPAGASVTWSMTNAPGWLSIHPATGELSGTPSPTDTKYNAITLQIDNGTTNSVYRAPLTVMGGYDPDDTDADGLPDAWETNQFVLITVTSGGPAEDQDGDGASDRSEYIEGTLANDSNSYFRTPMNVTEGALTVSFDGVTNRGYVLHSTTDLVDGDWLYADSIENLESNQTVNLQADACGDPGVLFGRIGVEVD